ncbi:MAG: 2-phosphosulfolactate phosphatase [Verrucomicrobia bacterium]|nr:2-phosphosulfolactate phosphatase [Verrucomicrobiota bacterium]
MIIDAILTPAEIDVLPQADLSASVCVVFDVLRATSSIITGLAHGAEEIRPVVSIEEALSARAQWPDAVLGGERFGDRIDGFDLGNSPLEYCRAGLRRIVTTTTNGTVTLQACASAREVWVGALLNMQALVDRLRQSGPERVLLVCAGTFRELALEDVLAAGMLAAAFPEATLTDAAQVALALYRQHQANLCAALELAKNGRVLRAHGRAEDVAWCAQVSRFPIVGVLRDGVIRRG